MHSSFVFNILRNAFQWKLHIFQWKFTQAEGASQKANFLILLGFFVRILIFWEERERKNHRISDEKRPQLHRNMNVLEHGEMQSDAHYAFRMCSEYVRRKVLVHWPLFCFFFLIRCLQCSNRLYGNYYLSHYLVIMCLPR